MNTRPDSTLVRRPLHFIVLADCSGSMEADGKIQALNNAFRETVPHLVDVAAGNPHAQVLVRVVRFGDGARWHIEVPTPVEEFVWADLDAGGYTDLGAAIRLVRDDFEGPTMPDHALPPALVLISDGLPTDDWRAELAAFLETSWGSRSLRTAIAIGRDAAREVLAEFVSDRDIGPVSANNPEQLVSLIRWATVHTSRAASEVLAEPAKRFGPVPQEAGDDAIVW